MEQIKGQVDDFNGLLQTDTVSEYGKFDECLSNETDAIHHKNATYSYQEQYEEIPEYVDPSKVYEEFSTEQINRNDIFFKDIKRELGEEVNELHRFCEVCKKSFSSKTDFNESKDEKLECNCREQNCSVNPQDRDVKPSSLIPAEDFGLKLLRMQEKTISEANNQVTPVEPQRNLKLLPIPTNIADDSLFSNRKCPSTSVETVFEEPQISDEREKKFQCEFCSKSLTNVDLHHCKTCQAGEKLFTCKICSKSFRHSQSLKNHENIHSREKLFHCKICSKAFTISCNLKAHERIHSGEKPFHCKLCFKSFGRLGSLKIHERFHTGERPYHCKDCSKSFISNSVLKDHEKTHQGEKLFHCKTCSKSFKRAKTLKDHEIIHMEEKPFSCKLCSKSFRSLRYLTVHEKNHAGEKPFQCEICLKSFKLAKTLKVHGTIHMKERPFCCNICFKSFGYSRDLKIHERVHTGERPYHCKICSKSYVSQASLRVHAKMHTEYETDGQNFEAERKIE